MVSNVCMCVCTHACIEVSQLSSDIQSFIYYGYVGLRKDHIMLLPNNPSNTGLNLEILMLSVAFSL